MKNTGGFTLIELMVVLAISSVLGLLLITVFAANNTHLLSTTTNLNNQNNARMALDLLTNEVRRNDISGKIFCDYEKQALLIRGERSDQYCEFYYSDGYLVKKTKNGKQEHAKKLYKLKQFVFEPSESGKFVFIVAYEEADGSEKLMRRMVVSRTN